MRLLLRLHEAACVLLMRVLMLLVIAIDEHRQALPKRARRWRSALRKLYCRFLERHGQGDRRFIPRRVIPANRTPDYLEVQVVRLHVEHTQLGAGQLRLLASRVLGFFAARETIRQILIRRRDLVVELEQVRRKRPRRIKVSGVRQPWGVDATLIWVLGFLPAWIVGVIDYHGSRLVAFERVAWPTAAAACTVVGRAMVAYGAPDRLISDRAPCFTAGAFDELLVAFGVRHILIRPGHAWTNGRIERVFRTFKETTRRLAWIFASYAQVDRFAADFLGWYDGHRPHSAWGGKTPDEVFFGLPVQRRPLGLATFFDGKLAWYRFR